MTALGDRALEAAIRSADGVEAQRLLNILTGAKSVPVETIHTPPFEPSPAPADPLPAALEHFQLGTLPPRDMLRIVADMSVNMRAGGVSINAGFLEGLAGIILRTPLDELDALRRELLSPSPEVTHESK